jgi:hypothetical protein
VFWMDLWLIVAQMLGKMDPIVGHTLATYPTQHDSHQPDKPAFSLLGERGNSKNHMGTKAFCLSLVTDEHDFKFFVHPHDF